MLEAVSMMGEACLWADKYHTRKVCQERISQDLIDGEISSIPRQIRGEIRQESSERFLGRGAPQGTLIL